MVYKLLLMLPTFVAVSGCALFASPKEDPVQQDFAGGVFSDRKANVFSLTPERRTVLVIRKVPKNMLDDNERVIFCAEPPPDVAESIVSTFRALVEASVKQAQANLDVKATAELSRGFSSVSASIFRRSQGVQLFRDGLFSLCQAAINGLITNSDYQAKYADLVNTASTLIQGELKATAEMKLDDAIARVNEMAAQTKVDRGFTQADREKAEQAAQRAAATLEELKKKQ